MRILDFLIAILVIVIWGFNFIFIKYGLDEIPPLLFCAIRFFLASIPIIFFIKLPKVPFKMVALYGMTIFGLQFSCLFTSMYVGMTPSIASVLIQTQVFFSLFFAAIFLKQKLHLWQIGGALISFSGIALVGIHLDQSISLLGFLLVVAGAASWGVGNLFAAQLKHVNPFALVAWGSFVACIPTFFFSLLIEGPGAIILSYTHISALGIIAILYVVYLSTWTAYGAWNWLLSRHSVATIAPFTLLVPVVGMLSSAWILNEPIPFWKILVAILVTFGLLINLLGARYFARKNPPITPRPILPS